MKAKLTVAFVSFQEFENLGIGYLRSVLEKEGYRTIIIDINSDKRQILEILRTENPAIVGFSIIYQYYIERFRDVIGFLRKYNINSHFTGGGHFASLKTNDLFQILPWLDSIVRFEGEYTMLELANCIASGKDWKKVKGLAYRGTDNKVILNPLRTPVSDLDEYPFPVRSEIKRFVFDRFYASITAGRGCRYNCAFCNMSKFYSHPGWKLKRTRHPKLVVDEIQKMHLDNNCSVFLFEDDDFPVSGRDGSNWVKEFCNELSQRGLSRKVSWKINCRADEIDEDIFGLMKNSGLFLVFVGIEDGTNEGLKNFNKGTTVKKMSEGINKLKKLRIGLDYGFILFHPLTTFGSLRKNLNYLLQTFSDGTSPISYLRLNPYYETRIEQYLINTGRLKGIPSNQTYDFIEPALDSFYEFTSNSFGSWLNDPDGFVNISKWARNHFLIASGEFPAVSSTQLSWDTLNSIISEGNSYLINTLLDLAGLFENEKKRPSYTILKKYKSEIARKHNRLVNRVEYHMSDFLLDVIEHYPGQISYCT